MRSLIVLFTLLSGFAFAAPSAPSRPSATAAPTAQQQKAYRAAMKAGKQAAAKGDLAAALASFGAASTALGGDARALSELGLVALRKKDYALATDATTKSIALTAEPSVKGASLYNLGRILEEKGDRAGAAATYARSLEARPNAIVRKRLAILDPAKAAELDRVAPHLLAGPYAKIADFCVAQKKLTCDAQISAPVYTCGVKGSPLNVKAPYSSAELVSAECHDPDMASMTETDHFLAVRLPAGWFVTANLGTVTQTFRVDEELTDAKLSTEDLLPGGGSELVLRYTIRGSGTGGTTTDSWHHEFLVALGIGPSAKPSATGAILTMFEEGSEPETIADGDDGDDGNDDSASKSTTKSGKLTLRFAPGEIEIQCASKQLDGGTRAELIGKHAFLFP